MPARPAYTGKRYDFLAGERAAYKLAVLGGFQSDCIPDIQRRFFKRFPVSLPCDEEPTDEALALVDDSALDPEHPAPDDSSLDDEAFAQAQAAFRERQERIKKEKEKICRWLKYQHKKDHGATATASTSKKQDPFQIFFRALNGTDAASKPRLLAAHNLWRKDKVAYIENGVLQELQNNLGSSKKQLVNVRDAVARRLFSELPEAEIEEWKAKAEAKHDADLEVWEAAGKQAPSTSPEDRQRCIENLVKFIQPILDTVCACTGLKATFIAGGPEPADGGRLNVISVHSGLTNGEFPMNFGRAQRANYKKHILPAFGAFLKRCYTIEECRSRALPDLDSSSLAKDLEAEGASLDRIDEVDPPLLPDPSKAPAVSTPPPRTTPTSLRTQSPPMAPSAARHISTPSPSRNTARASCSPSPPPTPLSHRAVSPPLTLSRAQTPRATTPLPQTPSHAQTPRATTPLSPQGVSPPLTPSHAQAPRPTPPRSPGVQPLASPFTPARARDQAATPEPSARPSPPAVVTPFPAIPAPSTTPSLPLQPSAANLTGTPSSRARGSKRSAGNETPTSPPTKRTRLPPADPTIQTRASKRPHPRLRTHVPSQRLSTSAQTPASPPVPASSTLGAMSAPYPPSDTIAPPWFTTIHRMLDSVDQGPTWGLMLRTWAAFEVRQDFATTTPLSAKGRPSTVGDWIQRARIETYRPVIANLDKYEQDFRLWWTSLQPAWRLDNGRKDAVGAPLDGGLWNDIQRSGKNGVVSVLAALFFWSSELQRRSASRCAWDQVVEDVAAVFALL